MFFKRWSALIILLIGLIAFFYFGFDRYLTFEQLKAHRYALVSWTHEHYVKAALLYMLIYLLITALSIPGGALLTLVGGFLFGIFWGTLLTVVSATIGATCVFLAVRIALEPWLAKRANKWIQKMRSGFKKDAFQYLLVLRLIPLFPFWIVNIVPALLGVNASTFIIATLIGIIPGTIVYILLGNGLGYVLDQNQTPNLSIVFEPQVFVPLLLLAVLVALPTVYKIIKKRNFS